MLKNPLLSLLFCAAASMPLVSQAAETTPASPPTAVVAQAAQAATVNLNSADAATLQRELKGIGAVKAQAIISHREANGPFSTVDDLLEVKGIGPATLEKIRDKLSVN